MQGETNERHDGRSIHMITQQMAALSPKAASEKELRRLSIILVHWDEETIRLDENQDDITMSVSRVL
jgi:hypothetical protein